MSEDFLLYIWQFRLFDHQNLYAESGEKVEILSYGKRNEQSGPDFFNGKVKIGETTWAGNIEMHLKSSDWLRHQHQHDEAYENVILHVVLEADCVITDKQGNTVPTIALQDRLPHNIHKNYLRLQASKHWIPCQEVIGNVPEFTISAWLDRLLVERLQRKTQPILASLEANKHSWENTFYQVLARAFGAKFNADPFEALAKSLPLVVLGKHKDKLLQVEALLFGQAGLLNVDFKEEYPQRLKKEYGFLKQKFSLTPLHAHTWKFGGLRPPNFPTIRIAQFAALVHQSSGLFSQVLEIQTIADFQNLFAVQLSDYWDTHYVFDKASSKRRKSLGKSTINSLLINTIAPILFIYGKERGKPKFEEKAFTLLETLPQESNTIIKKWTALGIAAKSAFESQALLQLKNEYCSQKRCLECAIGNKVMRS